MQFARILRPGASILLFTTLGMASDSASSACPGPESRQFDFWRGEWNVVNKFLQGDSSWKVGGPATNKVYAALDGCVIIEHWQGRPGNRPLYGFSIRAYDPQAKEWVLLLLWPSPNNPQFGTLRGVFTHGRGDFFTTYTQNGKTIHQRYSFSDISPEKFRWDGSQSEDLLNWKTTWIMEFSRRSPDALPLFNGPALRNSFSICEGEEFSAFDFLVGGRKGQAAVDGKTYDIRTEAYPILKGCAVMDFTTAAKGHGFPETFSIRAFEVSKKKWVLYRYDTRTRVFESLEGEAAEGRIELAGQRRIGDQNVPVKVTWSGIEKGPLKRESVYSPDGGTSWKPLLTLTYPH